MFVTSGIKSFSKNLVIIFQAVSAIKVDDYELHTTHIFLELYLVILVLEAPRKFYKKLSRIFLEYAKRHG